MDLIHVITVWLTDHAAPVSVVGTIVQGFTAIVIVCLTRGLAKATTNYSDSARLQIDEMARQRMEMERQREEMALQLHKMEQQRLDAVQPQLVLCETQRPARGATMDFKEVLGAPVTIDLQNGSITIHNFGVGLARDIVVNVAVEDQASPDVALPPLAPESWTITTLSPL